MKDKIYQTLMIVVSSISLMAILEIMSGIYVKNESYKEFDTLLKSPCFSVFNEQPEIQKSIYRESIDNRMYVNKFGYGLKDFNGQYQNVTNGIRKTCNKNKDSKKNIYLFGGSTVEGVGVRDCETIPSYLQKDLPDFNITNMGIRGNFSVTEERKLRELSPEQGSLVIFFDGLNDNFYELEEVGIFKDPSGLNEWIKSKVNDLDLYKGLKLYLGRMKIQAQATKENAGICTPKNSNSVAIHINKEMKTTSHDIAKRYLATKSSIENYCIQRDINCIFIAQPVPSYRYSKKLYFYDTRGGFSNRQADYGQFIKEIASDERVIDLSGALDGVEKAYIDKVHYSPYANEILAKEISKVVIKNTNLY